LTGTTYIAEAGRKIRIEAVIHLLDWDGWKVNDMIILAADGQRLDAPVSVVADSRGTGGQNSRPTPLGEKTRTWYEDSTNERAAVFGALALLKAGGLKYIGGLLLVIGGGIWAWLRRGIAGPRTSR
jgi:hypothetical protein